MSTKKHAFYKWRYPILAAAVISIGGLLGWGMYSPTATANPVVTVYKDPRCGCCGKWVEHMRESGFEVIVNNMDNMRAIKRRFGIPGALQSCHTATVGDYVIEGHVPAASIKRLLAERIPTSGLAVPRMPIGSPGMEGPNPVNYDVMQFDQSGKSSVFEKKMGKSTRN